MRKKKASRTRKRSLLSMIFSKFLVLAVIIATVPFTVWGVGQLQQILTLGKSEIKLLETNPVICPTTSTQQYSSLQQVRKLNFDPATNPETNIYMRGWYEVNEGKDLISRNGDNTGLDPNMPPQISSLFTTHYPKIIKTYRVNAWDYINNHNIPGDSATPAWLVHMLGLEAIPGEPLVGLKAGRTIDGTNVFHVQYATKNSILFIHGAGEDDGYPYFFLDICVDPNLLAAYERDNANGRNELPVVATGQVFGYAMTNEVKFIIRDSGSFMDTRYKEDWWEYGGFTPGFPSPNPSNPSPTAFIPSPTSSVPTSAIPSPTANPLAPPSATPNLPSPSPTGTNPYSSPSPSARPNILSPTPTLAEPTLTPLPAPCIPNWCFIQQSDCCFDPICIVMGSVTNDPTKRCGIPEDYNNSQKTPQRNLFEELKNLFRSFF